MKTRPSILFFWLLASGFWLLASASAPPRDDNASLLNFLNDSTHQRCALTRLRQHAPNAALGTITLRQAFLTFQNGTGLTLKIDWPALRASGLVPETLVNIPGQNISYEQFLTATCASAGVTLVLDFNETDFTLTTQEIYIALHPDSKAVPAPAPQSEPYDNPAERLTYGRLEKTHKGLSFDHIPFEKALALLFDRSYINVTVNWTDLQAAGIDKNTPATLHLKDVPLRSSLRTLLAEVGGGAANLGYTLDDNGILIISTRDDLNSAKYQVVQVFNVRHLLVGPANSYDDRVRELVDTIKTTVAPETWRDAGGTIGSLRELNGNFIVNQTKDNQRAIHNLLKQLAETRRPRPIKHEN